MSTTLHFARDEQGYNADAPLFPTDIYTATLVADTETSIQTPGRASIYIMYVRVQPSGWVWCSITGTATEPAGSTLASSNSELIAGTIEYRRMVFSNKTVSFITPNTTCDIEVSFQIAI